jgi:signal transduction histidine kinase
MVALSLIALFVFIFGAYAYGATTVLAFRRVPVWGRPDADRGSRRPALEPVVLTLCAVCTVWFVLHTIAELRVLTGGAGWQSVPDLLAMMLSYAFPPLIMHNVLHETAPGAMDASRRSRWTVPVWAMYGLSALTGIYMFAAAFQWIPRPQPFAAWSGISVGGLFMLCSIYCIALMLQRPPRGSGEGCESASPPRQRRTMIGLFLAMIPLFFAMMFLRDNRLVTEALDRVTRTLPIYFLVTSIYFENRFEFYDLIVKRAVTLLASLLLMGLFLALTLGMLERLPSGLARPWLFAVALLPVAMALPRLHRMVGQWLDRLWLGREFTPVEAVKEVLSAMHPATDERTLAAATEARLSAMFHTRVRVLLDDDPAPQGAVVEVIGSPAARDSAPPVRVAVQRQPGSRSLLSEDVSLLRSLVVVFSYMLENVRLQRKRQEQDLVARDLRLQKSRSELKALRAQINPHFLFNALNAIASLIHTDPTRADAAVEQLAEVFRYTLRRSEHEWAPLDQELAFAPAYLDVEQARFGRRLTFAIDAKSVSGVQVPSMLLHTLVENAVKHGISQLRGTGRIDIRAAAGGDMLTLEVSDTGPGIRPRDPERSAGENFGLRSVRDRLRGHFGDRATLSLTRDDARGATVARIDMPLVREQSVVLR